MILEDRWFQEEAIDSIFNYFTCHREGNPVVAMPTGTGKSVVIAKFIQRVMQLFAGQRIMMLTHVKELIEQNALKVQAVWPQAPLGIYSAGLKSYDTLLPITFGGVASVYGNVHLFRKIDLLLIDEAHLVSPDYGSMYQTIIADLMLINPFLRVIGFTATPYRMGNGMLTDEQLVTIKDANGKEQQIDRRLFTHICYDITGVDAFNRLIAEGFLASLIPMRTKLALDLSGVGMHKGDYAQGALQAAVDKEAITHNALVEACNAGYNRQSWLLFAAGIEHAEHTAEKLRSFGIEAAAVHSKLKPDERDARIKAYKAGKLRCMTGNNVFTTGFDHPPLDLIIDLQPTMSIPKHVQKYGRGTRPSKLTMKENCMVLDYARNTQRLGPINDPLKPRRKGEGTGEAPIRICEHCDAYNHASARVCCHCGEPFTFKVKFGTEADTTEIIKTDIPVVEYYDVQRVIYKKHSKGIKSMLKVSYFCGMFKFDEYVIFEGKGYANKKARDWWRVRHDTEPPETVDEALLHISGLRVPKKVKVWVNKQFPEVLSYEW